MINRVAAARGEAAAVHFTFSLDGGVYRVMRRKPLGKTLVLEFQLQTDTGWKTLSEGKSRETQEAIEKLLRLTYDSPTPAFCSRAKPMNSPLKQPTNGKKSWPISSV